MRPVFNWMDEHPNVIINPDNFNKSRGLFNNLGISFDDFTDYLNSQISIPGNNSDILKMAQLEVEVSVLYYYILPVNPAPLYCLQVNLMFHVTGF